MPLIKRYPNRKLYNTAAREYISLEGIAALIARGEEVQVIDHISGEDLTSLTLMQIIVEKQKKQHRNPAHNLLQALLFISENGLTSIPRSILRSLLTSEALDELIGERVRNLMQTGRLSIEQGKAILESLSPAGVRTSDGEIDDDFLQQRVADFLKSHHIPSRQDIVRLSEQIEELTARLETLTRS